MGNEARTLRPKVAGNEGRKERVPTKKPRPTASNSIQRLKRLNYSIPTIQIATRPTTETTTAERVRVGIATCCLTDRPFSCGPAFRVETPAYHERS